MLQLRQLLPRLQPQLQRLQSPLHRKLPLRQLRRHLRQLLQLPPLPHRPLLLPL
jgi:hypothetical protein